nr:peptide ABC transporter substrate-binding protein [uncultured Cohaesibacter sp.]
MKNSIAALLLAGVCALPLVATSATAEVVYNRGNSADPETLDQHKTQTVYEAHILRDLYEGLLAYSADGKCEAAVAKSWDVSPDGKTYTFHFRDDAKWSNGDPVVAGDFVFSLRRIEDPATGSQYSTIMYPIVNAEKVNKGELPKEELAVKAIDDKTLEIDLNAPTPYFLGQLCHQSALPVHPASVEKYGDDFSKPGNMVSNGAFTLAEFVPNSHVKAVKNPMFHDAADVKIDAVMYYPTEDRGAALRRFQAGELDSNNDAPVEQVDFMRENLGDQFRVAPYLGTYYYAVNTTEKKLADPKVRRALSMAIDRDFLADDIWGGTMLPGYSLVPPGIANYGEPAYADYKDMDQLDREDAAKKLLEEAGYSEANPLEVEIRYNTSENHKNTAVAIADMWKPIGVKTTLLNTDTKTHYANLREHSPFDFARAGWIGDYSDPQNFLMLVESDSGFNYAQWKNKDYDALMDKAAATVDLDARAKILFDAEKIFMANLPYVPLLYYSSLSLVSDKLHGWEDNLLNVHPSRWMSKD